MKVAGGNSDMQESSRCVSKSHSSQRPSVQALPLRGILASELCPQCLTDLPKEYKELFLKEAQAQFRRHTLIYFIVLTSDLANIDII